ncbi:hypothetical protein EMPG_11330 [Blastomyces silverae]|uniref:Uncharacterized protein n=1 Tax=Blastomyces silverae TaxID=2060906 RepID=A0A0H1BRT3_9EURO|nr:hypothetical protein EMPG_11330 [Blastomyces silverae]
MIVMAMGWWSRRRNLSIPRAREGYATAAIVTLRNIKRAKMYLVCGMAPRRASLKTPS